MGFLSNLFAKKEDNLKEVISVKPFRDPHAGNKYRYQILVKGSDGIIYSGILLATAVFPEINQKINLKEWTSTDLFRQYKEDWQNMYQAKSITQLNEMPKIGEICVDVLKGDGEYSIYLGEGLFLVLPNVPDGAKVNLYCFGFLGGSDVEGAYISESQSYGSIIPLGEVLSTPDTLEACKEYTTFSGDDLTVLNLAIKTLNGQKSEATKKIDEMAAFNKLIEIARPRH